MSEYFGNGKDTAAMSAVNEFRGHGSRVINGIFVAEGTYFTVAQ